MAISEHCKRFAGKPVQPFDSQAGIADPTGTIYRLSVDYDESEEGVTLSQKFETFLADSRAYQVPGIVIGCWNGAWEGDGGNIVIDELVAAAEKLPSLRAIFIGDITYDECEISWIVQSDVSRLWTAYPKLEEFRVRGNNGLVLGPLRHPKLKSLVIETGGLSSSVIKDVCAADLPQLEHLELWLGSDNYGWEGSVDVLQPILSGELFPRLEYLGLRDSEVADEVAGIVATAPVVRRLKVLDLSLGNMTDEGAKVLLSLPIDAPLQKLDLHHHFISPTLIESLSKWLPFAIDFSDPHEPQGDDGWRFIAVSE